MIKILLITREIYPIQIGGIGIHVHYVTMALSKKFKVLIFANNREDYVDKKINVHSVIERIPLIYKFFLSPLFFIIRGLFTCIQKGKPDIIHAHQALTPAILAYLLSKLYRTPFIISCHGSEIRVQKNIFIKLAQWFLFKKAHHITVVSFEMKKFLSDKYCVSTSKISVIPNGYDEKEIINLKIKPKDGRDSHFRKIVFVGSLREFKDPFTLLRGFKIIALKYPFIELHIVGDGPMKRQIEVFCSKNNLGNVILEGKKSHKETLRIIAESDVFISTSIEEGLPTALIEAMSLGVPVISTNVGGVTELIKNGINGILICPKSPQNLAQALERLLTDLELTRKLGSVAAESIKNYTWTKIAEKYEAIYKEILNSKRSFQYG